jgi:hypothetical protein
MRSLLCAWLTLSLFVVAGCVESSSTVCVNGVICPPGTVCSAITGACVDGTGCGDGLWASQEVCDSSDEAYTSTGGLCSSDCLSSQICGNGYTDLEVGEQCDDGIHPFLESMSVGRIGGLNGDGCNSQCQKESPRWLSANVQEPAGRIDYGFAYDAARGQTVLFGGTVDGGGDSNETWLWDGAAWKNVTTATPPPGRHGLAMAYDAARTRTIAFGGLTTDEDLPGTWSFDGITWTQLTPAHSPIENLRYHSMAYDHARKEIVLFGGAPSNEGAKTWTWNGEDWIEKTPVIKPGCAEQPGALEHADMAYDAKRGQVILFGGAAGGPALGNTWSWDGASWCKVATTGPAARTRHAMAYDAVLERVVLYGGFSSDAEILDDTWSWDGDEWLPLSPGNDPGPLENHAMAYDAARGHLVLFGGDAGLDPLDATWVFAISNWFNINPSVPEPRILHAMAFDSKRGTTVLFGGALDGLFYVNDTWEWDGTAWRFIPDSGPEPTWRGNVAMAFDPVRKVMVLTGGVGPAATRYPDSWEYDGSGWVETSYGSFPARDAHGMVFDEVRGKMILFGGRDSADFDDMWEWNSTAQLWTSVPQMSPHPGGRSDFVMVYDPIRQEAVLFGGLRDGLEVLGDTWLWNGNSWRQADVSGPAARTFAAATWDPVRQTVVMHGGYDALAQGLADAWEWNGTAWSKIPVPVVPSPPALAPPVRIDHALFFDPLRGQTMLFGGMVGGSGDTALDDMLALSYALDEQPVEACLYGVDTDRDGLLGCDDPDCWVYCTPSCAPGVVCDPVPECGDSDLTTCRLCTDDNVICDLCGDFFCDAGENASNCPGDCTP